MVTSSKQKFKIAIGFFGHLRTFDFCAPKIKQHVLQNIDYDLYMHSWSTLDHYCKTWEKRSRLSGQTDKEKIIEAYGKFQNIIIEEQIVQDYDKGPKIKKLCNSFGMVSCLHSITEVIRSIRDSGIEYDAILLLRPDIYLCTDFNTQEWLSALQNGQILKLAYFHYPEILLSDLFFFGRAKDLFKLIEKSKEIQQNIINQNLFIYQAEDALAALLHTAGLKPYYTDKFKCGLDYMILRPSYILNNKLHLPKIAYGAVKYKNKLQREFMRLSHQISHFFKRRGTIFM